MHQLFQRGGHVGEPGLHDECRCRQGHRAQVLYHLFFILFLSFLFFIFRIGLHQLEMLRHQLTGTLHSTKMAKVSDQRPELWWSCLGLLGSWLSYDHCPGLLSELWPLSMIPQWLRAQLDEKAFNPSRDLFYKVDTICYFARRQQNKRAATSNSLNWMIKR